MNITWGTALLLLWMLPACRAYWTWRKLHANHLATYNRLLKATGNGKLTGDRMLAKLFVDRDRLTLRSIQMIWISGIGSLIIPADWHLVRALVILVPLLAIPTFMMISVEKAYTGENKGLDLIRKEHEADALQSAQDNQHNQPVAESK